MKNSTIQWKTNQPLGQMDVIQIWSLLQIGCVTLPSCSTSLSFFISVFLLLNGAILTDRVVWLLDMILLSSPVYIWCSANGRYYCDYYYCYERSWPCRVSVRTTFCRGNHQDESGRAELDVNSLCVSIKEILFFPLGKIQICLRKELGVSSLCSRCFRDS